ncbi:HD domain-containing protein [Leisingera sp.]|uniref:HD domain-containing protein n=1 Tax=Leisingera sp. TaxID=1879318 RepID=UPI002B277369|nr:HD domain-containing protein [Leisingera sp.]
MIKDPIHVAVEFEGDFENSLKDMLSDQFFQRLRRVKQLGFSDFVFPSATHSRFAHSLGVYAVAKRILKVVEPEAKRGKWSQKGQACLAAALVHDVGHGMFSHAFENAAKLYLAETDSVSAQGIKEAADHERVTSRILTSSSIQAKLVSIGGDEFPQLVADMIDKKDKSCIYTSIVSSQLDADRLDYAVRDPYFAGVSSGGIDLNWLMRNLQVGSGPKGQFLFVDSKAYISMEQFTVTLFQLYPTIYLHKKTRGLEFLFSKLLCQVFELVEDGREADAGISSSHPLARFISEPSDLENALSLDDTLFWGALHLFRNAPDETVRVTANDFFERKIPPMVDAWKLADEQIARSGASKKMHAHDRVKRIEEACVQACKEVLTSEDAVLRGCYHDTYNRPIYKPKFENGDAQQINVKVGGEYLDIAAISPLVASAGSFNIHRVYYDERVNGQGDELTTRLRVALEKALN